MVVKEKKQYEFYDQLQFPLPEKNNKSIAMMSQKISAHK